MPGPGVSVAMPGEGRPTLLVVEDDEQLAYMLNLVLNDAGYRVIVCGSAMEAMHKSTTSTENIQLLIADINLGEMDGLRLSQVLSVSRPDMKTLFTSGDIARAIEEHGIPQECCLAKPFALSKLISKVQELLAGAPAGSVRDC